MSKELYEWTDFLEDEDAFFDDLDQIKWRAYKPDMEGYLYFETALYNELRALVEQYDLLTKKNTDHMTEVLMEHILGDQYLSKTHKPIIGRLPDKSPRKQKKQVEDSIDLRKTSRIIFIEKPL